MIEAQAVLSWAVGTLAASGITAYAGSAPADAPAPWCVLGLGTGEDVLTGGNDRGYIEIPMLVRISDPNESASAAYALAEKADGALHGKTATVSGRSIHCARIDSTAFAGFDEGKPVQVVAMTFRITIR